MIHKKLCGNWAFSPRRSGGDKEGYRLRIRGEVMRECPLRGVCFTESTICGLYATRECPLMRGLPVSKRRGSSQVSLNRRVVPNKMVGEGV